ncbi:MAG: M20/M25/M40 family metallo-hydrolase [Candidatus Bipolaricaulia bacterium]
MAYTQQALDYANGQREQYLNKLIELLSIESISTLPEHRNEVRRAAEWIAAYMRTIGFQRAEVLETEGHPVIYGEWLAAPGRPTVLVYGHYDVQPVDPLEEWQTKPFEPEIKDDYIYARGSSDDKGQFFAHLAAAEAYLKTIGELPVNVKFLIDGEEEIGSAHLEAFVADHRDLLNADVALISDSQMISPNQPAIIYGLRGLVYMEVEVRGPKHDLHSGLHGGAVHNPLQALCEMIAKLHDEQGRVTIPGFYDHVRPLSAEERTELARLPFDEAQYRQEIGVPQMWGEVGYSVVERLGVRPTLERYRNDHSLLGHMGSGILEARIYSAGTNRQVWAGFEVK